MHPLGRKYTPWGSLLEELLTTQHNPHVQDCWLLSIQWQSYRLLAVFFSGFWISLGFVSILNSVFKTFFSGNWQFWQVKVFEFKRTAYIPVALLPHFCINYKYRKSIVRIKTLCSMHWNKVIFHYPNKYVQKQMQHRESCNFQKKKKFNCFFFSFLDILSDTDFNFPKDIYPLKYITLYINCSGTIP